MPEVIFGEGKAKEHILGIARAMLKNKQQTVLITRLAEEAAEYIKAELPAVEQSESYLFSLGFTDFRVRLRDGGALLQFTEKQHGKAENELEAIKAELSRLFDTVKLDPKARIESK